MAATMIVKGQVSIPKQIRDSMGLQPGVKLNFAVNRDGKVVLNKAERKSVCKPDRFDTARGKSDVKWRTKDLMALLRGEA